ncbi:hypothetical protein V6N13_037366 [Hibiscus sabdariffa]|uniref:Uncharacterized protein n=1 Tax=Hibiscus sabdariffa TaxID=183260 RepID=A0ABR1ZA03_9ROSI
MLFSHGWWHPHRPILCAWLFGESSVGRCVAWIALCCVIGTYVVGKTGDPFPIQYVQLSVWPSAPGWLLIVACGVRLLPAWELKLQLVQSLIGLRFAALVGAARREPNALPYLPMHAHVLPGCVLWSVVPSLPMHAHVLPGVARREPNALPYLPVLPLLNGDRL